MKRRRLIKATIISFSILIAVFLVILAATPPLIMKGMVGGHVDFKRIYAADEFGLTSQRLSLTTNDGLNIAAYEVCTPSPKAVVIFLSGIHNPSVTAFYGHSKMLLDNNYSSILVEMRAHGESEGNVISLGFKEYLDVRAAVDYIRSGSRYAGVPIVVYGVSMGGATAINSIGEIPEIDALISMSAFSSWEDVFCDNMLRMGAPRFLAALEKPFVKIYNAIKYGLDSYSIAPRNEIRKLGGRPALIIHSKDDSQVPYQSFERILANAPDHIETWVREGDLHFIVENDNFTNPQKDREYAERILGFLGKHFGQKE